MKNLIKTSSLLLLLSCSSGPSPIQYGKDNCDFCKMTIMDQKFGTEIITKKGKVFRFDSDECMRDYYKADKAGQAGYAQIFVTDYDKPGTLIDAKTAFFLHGPKVKSPMGGNLAAFSSKLNAEKLKGTLGGEILTWEQMLETE